ncbi:uncharacterized protein TRAVEDRAFT_23996 [Trametes versicolor FP-101664 SS1]|uniref:uncharacterized protein n=1 Tax=Trametes versicolor (strain FP-101664) TaxID=717944 RepID=UPI0004622AAA|nr:uncharacterized protein TRAVEDRAFT_23996 [Trametes versicolor FP-101664 SS1]EIW53779.1 hypothetical protein TRAVEDRAFT_23996 [Trametes versicolor FP-101664 SS1]
MLSRMRYGGVVLVCAAVARASPHFKDLEKASKSALGHTTRAASQSSQRMAKGRKCVGDYARQELWMRGFLRHSMAESVQTHSGDPDAGMAYSVRGFHKKVYVQQGLELDGWPSDIPFTNLSNVTGFARISALFVLWQTGLMKFVPVALSERERAARNPADVAPGTRNNGVPPNLGRSDIKKHRKRAKVDVVKYPPRHVRNGTTSDKWVTARAEAEARAEADAGRRSSGAGRATDRAGREDPSDPIEDWEDEPGAAVSTGLWDLRQSWSRRVEAVMYRNTLDME